MTRERVKDTRARHPLPMLSLAAILALSACEGPSDGNGQDQTVTAPTATTYRPPASLKPVEATIVGAGINEVEAVDAYDSPRLLDGGPPRQVDTYTIGQRVLVLCIEAGRPLPVAVDPSNPRSEENWYLLQTPDPQNQPNHWVSKEFVQVDQAVPSCPRGS